MNLWALLVALTISSSSWAIEDSLHSFAKELDGSLQRFNSGPTCNSFPNTVYHSEKTTYKKRKVSVLSEEEAQMLFADMQSHSEIPFQFPYDGCRQKAHEMSRLMLLKGITPLKAFISVSEKDKSARLQFPDPKDPNTPIKWTFHVAPLVMVKVNGKVLPYIIDPTTTTKAVPLQAWREQMMTHNKKMKVRTEIYNAERFDSAFQYDVDFSDSETNKSFQDTLKKYKEYQDLPDGKEKLRQDLMREQEEQGRF